MLLNSNKKPALFNTPKRTQSPGLCFGGKYNEIMKESLESPEPLEALESRIEPRVSKKEIKDAKIGFEKLAQRLDILWHKKKLTPEEEKEVELILNNAMILEEMRQGEIPRELRQ